MTPEFSRPMPRDRIGPRSLDITVDASATECAALAARLRLPGVHSLTCRFHLRAAGDQVAAEGWLAARITQTCVVSLEDFDSAIMDHFTVRFVPAGSEADDIDPEREDEIPYAGNILDLGEAATEQLALTLDPWPRKPGAQLPESSDVADATASRPPS